MTSQILFQATEHHAAGRYPQAEALYRQALALDPSNADALHLLGRLALETGRPGESQTLIAQAVRLRPRVADYAAGLGETQLALGQIQDAVQSYRRAVRLNPNDAVLHYLHGVALSQAGQPAEALQAFRRALTRDANYAAAQGAVATTLLSLNRAAEAETAYRSLLARAPNDAAILFGYGCAFQAQNKFAEAAQAFEAVITLEPAHLGAQGNLAVVLRELDRYAEAEAPARQAVMLAPNSAGALSNLGTVLRELGRTSEAVDAFEAALRLDPGHAEAHFMLAYALLLAGNYAPAWPHFAYRPAARAGRLRWPGLRWDATETNRLLIYAEQGIGDFIQCARFIPIAAAYASEIILAIPPALHRIAAAIEGVSEIIPLDVKPPPFDHICADMDLPGLLAIRLEAIPITPYLAADPGRVAAWQSQLANLPGLRVGIAWSGNPTYAHDRQRSIAPALLEPLGRLKGVSFVALQPASVAPLDAALFPLPDFAETAALIAALDLTITVDTAVAHLAGALDRPVWLLNRFAPDWRWLLNRNDSPWYPSLTQFRQSAPGDWATPLNRIKGALEEGEGRASHAFT